MTTQVQDVDARLDELEGSHRPAAENDGFTGGRRVAFGRLGAALSSPRRRALAAAAAAVLALIALVIWATGDGTHQGPPTNSVASPATTTGVRGAAGAGSSATYGASSGGQTAVASAGNAAAPQATAAGASGAATSGLPNEVPTLSSKVVKTGTLQLQVASGALPSAVGRLSSDATGLSGFVASTSESTGGAASGDVTLRVPVANFDTLVVDAQKLGKTLQLTTTGQDVTAQYVDLQARIQSLQTARTQFEQILARAQSIGDILAVESQISDLQTQVEQLQGQFRVLDDQATYSTLTIQIGEAGKPVPTPPKPKVPSGMSKAWSHARHSFAHGAESILAATGGIALFVVTVAIVTAVGWIAWVGIRRRARQPAATADRA